MPKIEDQIPWIVAIAAIMAAVLGVIWFLGPYAAYGGYECACCDKTTAAFLPWTT